MKSLILTVSLVSFSLFAFSQEKTEPATNKAETTQASVKVVKDKTALKAISSSPNTVEKKRHADQTRKVERSAEMIEKKKTAPLLNEPN